MVDRNDGQDRFRKQNLGKHDLPVSVMEGRTFVKTGDGKYEMMNRKEFGEWLKRETGVEGSPTSVDQIFIDHMNSMHDWGLDQKIPGEDIPTSGREGVPLPRARPATDTNVPLPTPRPARNVEELIQQSEKGPLPVNEGEYSQEPYGTGTTNVHVTPAGIQAEHAYYDLGKLVEALTAKSEGLNAPIGGKPGDESAVVWKTPQGIGRFSDENQPGGSDMLPWTGSAPEYGLNAYKGLPPEFYDKENYTRGPAQDRPQMHSPGTDEIDRQIDLSNPPPDQRMGPRLPQAMLDAPVGDEILVGGSGDDVMAGRAGRDGLRRDPNLPRGVTAGGVPYVPKYQPGLITPQKGVTNDPGAVREWQRFLIKQGILSPGDDDGDFGAKTTAATKLFQIQHDLGKQDGVVGPETRRAAQAADGKPVKKMGAGPQPIIGPTPMSPARGPVKGPQTTRDPARPVESPGTPVKTPPQRPSEDRPVAPGVVRGPITRSGAPQPRIGELLPPPGAAEQPNDLTPWVKQPPATEEPNISGPDFERRFGPNVPRVVGPEVVVSPKVNAPPPTVPKEVAPLTIPKGPQPGRLGDLIAPPSELGPGLAPWVPKMPQPALQPVRPEETEAKPHYRGPAVPAETDPMPMPDVYAPPSDYIRKGLEGELGSDFGSVPSSAAIANAPSSGGVGAALSDWGRTMDSSFPGGGGGVSGFGGGDVGAGRSMSGPGISSGTTAAQGFSGFGPVQGLNFGGGGVHGEAASQTTANPSGGFAAPSGASNVGAALAALNGLSYGNSGISQADQIRQQLTAAGIGV